MLKVFVPNYKWLLDSLIKVHVKDKVHFHYYNVKQMLSPLLRGLSCYEYRIFSHDSAEEGCVKRGWAAPPTVHNTRAALCKSSVVLNIYGII